MDPDESNVRDTIARMIRESTLPWGQCCGVTGMPTRDVMFFEVECERSYVKNKRSQLWGTILLIAGFFFCPPVAIFMWLVGYDLFRTPAERVGRDVVISIPILVCKDSQATVRGWGQSRLKTMLRGIPIYERLLNEYADATIHPRATSPG
jgi:hypothetical protein